MSQTNISTREIRTDIQALRGLAVALVVLFHAKLAGTSSCYLGVDVFFVISGYLIAQKLSTAVQLPGFRVGDFWLRRARRLLPAAYVTFAVTWLLSQYLVTWGEARQLDRQLLSALVFGSNFVLWKQSGYFYGEAELKPLLHTWSLAVEGQFYLLIPLLFVWLPKRWWWPVLWALTAVSLALCLHYQTREAAFYLLPFRLWELLLGALAALAPQRGWRGVEWVQHGAVQALAWLGIVGVSALPAVAAHPGWPALLICLCTAAILLARAAHLHRNLVSFGLARIGNFSYSIYLVHWPVLALANHVWMPETPMPVAMRIALVVASIALAWVLYQLVEKPFLRRVLPSPAHFAWGAGLSLCTLSVAVAANHWLPYSARPEAVARASNQGFGPACAQRVTAFKPSALCQSGPNADVLVWGDSFAMHLVQGLVQSRHLNVVQATQPLCAPLLGLAVVRGRPLGDENAAKACVSFNRSVVNWLNSPAGRRIRLVVVASPFDPYLAPGEINLMQAQPQGPYTLVHAAPVHAQRALAQTLAVLRQAGKEVVLVAPPPFGNYNIARCLERVAAHMPMAGVPSNCEVPLPQYHATRQPVLDLIDQVERTTGVKVVRFDPLLCNQDRCVARFEGQLVYNDKGHLSHAGGLALIKHLPID